MGRIQTGTDFRAFTDCDLVIEAATENEDVKREVFKNLVPHLKKEAMVATNTSSISITRLAATTDRPERLDRKRVVEGQSVSVRVALGGRRIIKQKRSNSSERVAMQYCLK